MCTVAYASMDSKHTIATFVMVCPYDSGLRISIMLGFVVDLSHASLGIPAKGTYNNHKLNYFQSVSCISTAPCYRADLVCFQGITVIM